MTTSVSAVNSVQLAGKIAAVLEGNSNMFVDLTTQLTTTMKDSSTQTDKLRSRLDFLRAAQTAITDPNDNDRKVNIFFTVPGSVAFDINAVRKPYALATGIYGRGHTKSLMDDELTNEGSWLVQLSRKDASLRNPTTNTTIHIDADGYKTVDLPIDSLPRQWTLSEKISPAQAYKYYQTDITRLEGELQSIATMSQQQQVKLTQFNGKYNDAVSLENSWNKTRHDTASGVIGNIGH